jgi:hypothetical protein
MLEGHWLHAPPCCRRLRAQLACVGAPGKRRHTREGRPPAAPRIRRGVLHVRAGPSPARLPPADLTRNTPDVARSSSTSLIPHSIRRCALSACSRTTRRPQHHTLSHPKPFCFGEGSTIVQITSAAQEYRVADQSCRIAWPNGDLEQAAYDAVRTLIERKLPVHP